MRILPQRFLDSFHEFGDRIADQTLDCCGSPRSTTTASSTTSLALVGPPEDMFAASIARLGKQLDTFLTPVPDVIVKEYDVTEFEARDEKEIVTVTKLEDATTESKNLDERQLDPPPLLEVVSMESSAENPDTVSLLCDNIDEGASTESSSVSSSEAGNQQETKEKPVVESTRIEEASKGPEELRDVDLEFAEDEKEITNAKVEKCEKGKDETATVTTQNSNRSVEVTAKSYRLDDLKLHKILGEGQFGQVWLVSPKKDNEQRPYALKVLSKLSLITEDLVDAIVRERDIMLRVKSNPFIVQLHSSFQNPQFVFLLEEFCQGGELFSVMHDQGKLPSDQAKFYSICIADALVFLHNHDIIFRDLKPENVMVDKAGYPKLIDFGYAKEVFAGERTYSFCGTPRYLSPEMIAGVGHATGVDHWALGILIFEQLTAENPFCYEGIDEPLLFQSIQQDDIDFSQITDEDALDIVQNLLEKDPRKRLGAEGSFEVLEHKWFAGMELAKLRAKQIMAPWLPKLTNAFDCCCFDDWEGLVESKLDAGYPELSKAEQLKFRDF